MPQQTHITKRIAVFESWSTTYNQSIVDLMLKKFGVDYRDAILGVARKAAPKEGEDVLDIATGTGTVALALAEEADAGCRITGIDITQSMLDAARRNVNAAGIGDIFEFRQASAEELPFADNSYDVVTSSLALHHTNVPSVLRECHRVLRPGGRVVIADVTANKTWRSPVGAFYKLMDQLYMLGTESNDLFCQFHTHEEWMGLMRNAKFAGVEQKFFEPKHSWSRGIVIVSGTKPSA
ncbi:methyltransferase domain-containing protein [Salidesulfovibrio onnuriiensis]|uniref:methyltransferase domain-containing protein n=1 Tax=Salidesulfovibrio onnuriiensis TaxID=2583823 RepID=UPI0011C9D88E|nr:methyltransferase domain-containing protein [Salidesulfovibrio onnuriiensis]